MSEKYIECPELCGKTIKLGRVYRDEGDGTEMQLDLSDGTSFACSFCITPVFEAKLVRAGVSGIEAIHRYNFDDS